MYACGNKIVPNIAVAHYVDCRGSANWASGYNAPFQLEAMILSPLIISEFDDMFLSSYVLHIFN